jgi:hypothetical protein
MKVHETPWHFSTELVLEGNTVRVRWVWTNPHGVRSAGGFATFHEVCEDAKRHGLTPDGHYTINEAAREHLACK